MRTRAGNPAFAVPIVGDGGRASAAQRHGGNTILTRFKKLFPGRRFPRPDDLTDVTDEQIRACGFSFAKIASIRDIAAKTLSGVVPASRQIIILSDDEIIERLTEVRGVGRWTVEMLLIFQLGRHDVLPADDFGVRSGFRRAYKNATCRRCRNCWRSANAGVRTAPPRRGISGRRRTRQRSRTGFRAVEGNAAFTRQRGRKAATAG